MKKEQGIELHIEMANMEGGWDSKLGRRVFTQKLCYTTRGENMS